MYAQLPARIGLARQFNTVTCRRADKPGNDGQTMERTVPARVQVFFSALNNLSSACCGRLHGRPDFHLSVALGVVRFRSTSFVRFCFCCCCVEAVHAATFNPGLSTALSTELSTGRPSPS